MKIVDFIRVDIEGFGSIQDPFTFEFNHSGINVLRGENGTGKTSVFNALAWALYGVNLKGVTKDRVATWVHLRKPSFRGTRVSVMYVCDDNTYEVVRHIAFKGKTGEHTGGDTMMVFINNELKSTGIQDSTKLVEDSLGINARMFLNSVLFGQRMKKLIEADDEDKRKVFDELFDAEWVKPARDNIKARHDEVSKKGEEAYNLLSSKKEMLIFIGDTKNKLTLDKATFEQNKTDNINRLTIEVAQAQEAKDIAVQSLKEWENMDVSGLDGYLAKEQQLVTEITQLTQSWNDTKDELAKLTQSKELVRAEGESITKQLSQYETDKSLFYTTKQARIDEAGKRGDNLVAELEDFKSVKTTREGQLQNLVNEGITPELRNTYAEYTSQLKTLGQELNALSVQEKALTTHVEELREEYETLTKHLETSTCFNCGAKMDADKISAQREEVDAKHAFASLELDKVEQSIISKSKEYQDHEALTQTLKVKVDRLSTYEELTRTIDDLSRNIYVKEGLLEAHNASLEEIKSSEFTRSLNFTQEDITLRTKEVERLGQKIEGLAQTISTLETDNKRAQEEVADVRKSIQKVNEAKGKIQECNMGISLAANTLDTLSKSLESIVSSTFPGEEQLTHVNSQLDQLGQEIYELTLRLNKLSQEQNQYKYWLDAFGANGVKAFIFEAMLSLLNESMDKYAQQLGVRVRFLMDLTGSRKGAVVTQCFKDGGVVLYDDLSGGEKQRVDIIQVFGVHDVVEAGKIQSNILLMDEVFENLDTEGIESVFELIRMKLTPRRAIYLITHLPEINTMFARVLNFRREGSTLIVD